MEGFVLFFPAVKESKLSQNYPPPTGLGGRARCRLCLFVVFVFVCGVRSDVFMADHFLDSSCVPERKDRLVDYRLLLVVVVMVVVVVVMVSYWWWF